MGHSEEADRSEAPWSDPESSPLDDIREYLVALRDSADIPDSHTIRSRPAYTAAAADALREKLAEAKRARPEVSFEEDKASRTITPVRRPLAKRRTTSIKRTIKSYSPTIRVNEDGDGGLSCTCVQFQNKKIGQLHMCSHVQSVFDNEEDGEDMLGSIKVPVFRNPGVMVTVRVDPPNKLGMSAVILQQDNFNHLGFIMAGQGRKSLRTLILDWAGGYDFGELHCTAVQHVGNANLVDGSRDRIARLADICMWFMSDGACTLCVETDGVPDI